MAETRCPCCHSTIDVVGVAQPEVEVVRMRAPWPRGDARAAEAAPLVESMPERLARLVAHHAGRVGVAVDDLHRTRDRRVVAVCRAVVRDGFHLGANADAIAVALGRSKTAIYAMGRSLIGRPGDDPDLGFNPRVGEAETSTVRSVVEETCQSAGLTAAYVFSPRRTDEVVRVRHRAIRAAHTAGGSAPQIAMVVRMDPSSVRRVLEADGRACPC